MTFFGENREGFCLSFILTHGKIMPLKIISPEIMEAFHA
jgi:hypothetical protein